MTTQETHVQNGKRVDELFRLIAEWAEARNLIKGATPQAQYVKLMEEFSEFATGVAKQDSIEIKDGLGDTAVVLTVLAHQLGTSPIDVILDQGSASIELLEFVGESPEATYTRAMIIAFGELATGISKKSPKLVSRGIASALILLELMCNEFGFEFVEALEHSYNEIKDRKGKMIDGVFVKEADLIAMGITE